MAVSYLLLLTKGSSCLRTSEKLTAVGWEVVESRDKRSTSWTQTSGVLGVVDRFGCEQCEGPVSEGGEDRGS
jgi:hypothetical protein